MATGMFRRRRLVAPLAVLLVSLLGEEGRAQPQFPGSGGGGVPSVVGLPFQPPLHAPVAATASPAALPPATIVPASPRATVPSLRVPTNPAIAPLTAQEAARHAPPLAESPGQVVHLNLDEAKQRVLANNKLLNIATLNVQGKEYAVKAARAD